MPYLYDWSADPKEKSWVDTASYYSYHNLERLYDLLEESDDKFVEYKKLIVCISKKKKMCSSFLINNKFRNDDSNLQLISKITFRDSNNTIQISDAVNSLQVEKVYTLHEFEGQGIASYMYALLIKNGYTLISDDTQFLGGKSLWKSMARRANLVDYFIRIYHKDDRYLKDGGSYNSLNIDDFEIWKKTEIGKKVLLVMSPFNILNKILSPSYHHAYLSSNLIAINPANCRQRLHA